MGPVEYPAVPKLVRVSPNMFKMETSRLLWDSPGLLDPAPRGAGVQPAAAGEHEAHVVLLVRRWFLQLRTEEDHRFVEQGVIADGDRIQLLQQI